MEKEKIIDNIENIETIDKPLTDYKTMSERLVQMIEDHGLKKIDVCEKLNLNTSYFSINVRKKTDDMSVRQLIAFAKLLEYPNFDVFLEDLMGADYYG